ncbi:MAG: hypothetical protein Q9217_000151 [Psora testacea]
MCLPIPHLVGSVEVEERRPRSWNEPRRKRLSFVNDRNRRSDEWALTPQHQPNRFPRNEQERWDLRQSEAQQRFYHRQLQFENHRRMLQHQHMQQLHGPPVPPGWHGQQGAQQQQQQPPHPLENRAHHGNSSDIIAIESGSDDSSDDDRGRGQKGPKVIKMAPRARLPKQIEIKPRKKAKEGNKHKAREVVDSSDSDENLVEVLIPKPKCRSRSRPRSRVRYVYDDSSDDSFAELERQVRSRRRGRW